MPEQQPATDDNPFAVSPFCSGHEAPIVESGDPLQFRIEYKNVVCGSQLILPKICIQTGQTDELIPVTVQPRFPSFKLVLIQRQCLVTYWLTRSQRKSQHLWSAVLLGAGVLAAVSFLFSVRNAGNALAIPFTVTGIGLFCIVSAFAILRSPSLRLVRFISPGAYYVAGFSDKHLQWISSFHGGSQDA